MKQACVKSKNPHAAAFYKGVTNNMEQIRMMACARIVELTSRYNQTGDISALMSAINEAQQMLQVELTHSPAHKTTTVSDCGGSLYCDNCNESVLPYMDYCPTCGARIVRDGR